MPCSVCGLSGHNRRTCSTFGELDATHGQGLASSAFRRVANAYRQFASRGADSTSDFGFGRPRPLLDGEYHVGLANFEGPGTRIDLPEVREAKPVNWEDAAAKKHDLAYYNAAEQRRRGQITAEEAARRVHRADDDFIQELDEIRSSGRATEPYNSLGRAGIETKGRIDQILSSIRGRPSTVYGGSKALGGVKRRRLVRLHVL